MQVGWDDQYEQTTDDLQGPNASDDHAIPVYHTEFGGGPDEATATAVATDAAGHTFTLPAAEVVVVPNAPADVAAAAQSAEDVMVTWTDASTCDSGFTVLRSDDGGQTYAAVGTTGAGQTSYDDAGLTPGTEYCYEVESTAADGVTTAGPGSTASGGPATTGATATTPSTALTLTADKLADPNLWNQVLLTWTYHGADESGYELESEDASTTKNFQLIDNPQGVATGGTESFKVAGLIAGDQYKFRVRVDRADGTVSDYVTTSYTVGLLPAGTATASVEPGSDASGATIKVDWSGFTTAAKIDVDVRGDAYPGDRYHSVQVGDDDGYWPAHNDAIASTGLTGDKSEGDMEFAVPIAAGTYQFQLRGLTAAGQPTAWVTTNTLDLGGSVSASLTFSDLTPTGVHVSWQGSGTLIADTPAVQPYTTYDEYVQEPIYGYPNSYYHQTYDSTTNTTTAESVA